MKLPGRDATARALLALSLLAGSGCGPARSPSGGDIEILPAGKAVDLTAQAAPGKVTIFDFYAEWCQPCLILSPRLEELARERPGEVALRKVDVIGWGSEAAVHQGIEYLPYLAVVDTDGYVAAEGDRSFTYLKERFGLDLLAALRGI